MIELPLDLDPQRTFSARQKVAMFERAEGRCEVQIDGERCGAKIINGKWVAGHIKAHGLGGRTVIENGQVECPDCSKATHAKDTGTCAKADRQGQRTGQQARRARNGPQIQSRSFNETLTRGFDGKVRKRKKRKI